MGQAKKSEAELRKIIKSSKTDNRDRVRALAELVRLGQEDLANHAFKRGYMYDKGINVPQDDAEALRYYRHAAEGGNTDAQYMLGVMHFEGRGVPKNDEEAVDYFRHAAEAGNALAQCFFGGFYALGKGGVEQDFCRGYMWISLASEQGNENALKLLDKTRSLMTSEQISEAERMVKEWREQNTNGEKA